MTVSTQTMEFVLKSQKAAMLTDGVPSAGTRKERLGRAIAMLLKYQNQIAEAVNSDFGSRSALTTKASEILSTVGALGYAIQSLDQWMQPEARELIPQTAAPGARAEVHYQPYGVVGVISPWNAPFMLSVMPLAGILGAGNRAMIKPSELTPASADLLAKMVKEYFDPAELAVFPGDQQVAETFAGLKFDHLMFTGSERVARQVMQKAAQNLVPVTLELGGKSPVIMGAQDDLDAAVKRLVHGKLLNGGQICISPDHAYVPRAYVPVFIDRCLKAASALYPTLVDNADYTAIIGERHYQRLVSLVDDARSKGAVIQVAAHGDSNEALRSQRKLPLHVITGMSDDMLMAGEEIFGPILPVIPYDHLAEVISDIGNKPRPLAIYYFGDSESEQSQIINHTWSGNIAINDVIAQGMREEIPYGGIGSSGMGCYKGIDGFKNFSHARPVFYQSPLEEALAPMRPPYSEGVRQFIDGLLQETR